jgi:TPR repeat protein
MYVYKRLSRIKKELFSKAVFYYQHLCNHSDLEYQVKGNYFLGKLYYGAKGPFFEDWTQAQSGQKAAFYFQRGADLDVNKQERALCRIMLGKLYLEGRGVEQSYERAVKFFEQAAAFRFRNYKPQNEAFFYLGELYEKGMGVEQSYEEAIKHYQKFTNSGFDLYSRKLWLNCVKAWERIGHFYQEGLGVEKNETKAAACFSKGKAIQEEMVQDLKIMSELSSIAVQKMRKRKREEASEASTLEPPTKRRCFEPKEHKEEPSKKRKHDMI